MHVLGLDIAKAKFDAHLIIETLERHATFPNTEAGFQQLKDWLERHRAPRPAAAIRVGFAAAGRPTLGGDPAPTG